MNILLSIILFLLTIVLFYVSINALKKGKIYFSEDDTLYEKNKNPVMYWTSITIYTFASFCLLVFFIFSLFLL